MKLFLVLSFVALAVAAPVQQKINYSTDNVQILRFDNDNLGLGNYRFAYEQTDGTKQEQQGEILNEGREDESIAIRGSYAWVGPDGVTYTVNYVADDNGFQPQIEQGPGGGVPAAVIASFQG
ncbi:endocuticle structural glycoprotein SgAbd-5-like [Anticarsia gemmatalis]|uniref:endocuticle structural glycoprotein SgAbd-5-like n=1 Tax=Anticarsia gemmatalis TaxID=129554 RepID=UPI003F7608C4